MVLQAVVNGLTGRIEFNEGKRSNFKLDLLKLKKEELRKVGHWTPSEGINITDSTAFYESSATNITLVVMTREVSVGYTESVLSAFCLLFRLGLKYSLELNLNNFDNWKLFKIYLVGQQFFFK